MRSRNLTAGVALAAAVSLAAAAAPAVAAPTIGDPSTRADGLASPLGLAVDQTGRAYVSQNFPGLLTLVDKKGVATTVATGAGEEISAPAVSGDLVTYVQVSGDHTSSWLYTLSGGVSTPVADLAAHEATENPDEVNVYGFFDLTPECEAQFVPFPPFPPFPPLGMPNYHGIVDTHAYGSVHVDGEVYIADAGANAILKADTAGNVTTVAVLPPSDPITVTAAAAAEVGWPECAVGHGYRTEPVPTDVDLGPDGLLYVTTLPGGPEDPSAGPRGSVWSVHPDTGETELVATGFGGATGLAVAPNGSIFVAELFGGPMGAGQVSVLPAGSSQASTVIELSMPSAISVRAETLYVTTDSLAPDAKLTVVPLKGTAHGR